MNSCTYLMARRTKKHTYLAVDKLQEFQRFAFNLVINGSHDCLDRAFKVIEPWSERSGAVLGKDIECQQICIRLKHQCVNQTKILQILLRLLQHNNNNFATTNKQTGEYWQQSSRHHKMSPWSTLSLLTMKPRLRDWHGAVS